MREGWGGLEFLGQSNFAEEKRERWLLPDSVRLVTNNVPAGRICTVNKQGFKWKQIRKPFTSSFGLIYRFVFLSLNGDAMKSIFYFYFLRYCNKCLELLPFGFICSLTIYCSQMSF